MEANAWAVNDLRQVRTGSSRGDYILLFLCIKFWSYGDCVGMAGLDAFLLGSQALSDKDLVVLVLVVDDLHGP